MREVKRFPAETKQKREETPMKAAVLVEVNKPLVIEEFGLPRDGQAFGISSKTTFRDSY